MGRGQSEGRVAAVSRAQVGSYSPGGGWGRLLIVLSPQMDVQLQVALPQPGRYALVVEYANKGARQELGVAVHTPQQAPQHGALTLHPCLYRWVGGASGAGGRVQPGLPAADRPCPSPSTLCRGTALDAQHHLAVFHLDTEASVQLTAEQARFFLVRP